MIEKKFGIIGKPLAHSLSPILHNYWFQKNKIFANYSIIEIEQNQIQDIILKIRNGKLQGINVTVPYKQAVIPFVDILVDDAKKTNSVNTLSLNEKGKIVGNNTDVYGIEMSFLKKFQSHKLESKKILILGAGGVAPSVVYALSKNKIKKIFISNRTLKKAEEIKKRFPFIEILKWKNVETEVKNMDVIVNATSLGMKGGHDFNYVFKSIKSDLIYFDVIYNPEQTKMTKKLKKKNIQTINGLEMFIYQGQKSFFLWNTIKPEINEELKRTVISELK